MAPPFNNRIMAHKYSYLAIALLFLTPSITYSFDLPTETNTRKLPPAPHFIAFNEALYELAFNVFLANKNLTDAFYLSQKAVSSQPKSIQWRKRYAEVCQWLQYDSLALEQWMILLKMTPDPKVEKEALRLATITHDYSNLIKIYHHQLKNGVAQSQVLTPLSKAMVENGDPEKALKLLESSQETPDNLEQIIDIQINLGHLEAALVNLKRLNLIQKTTIPHVLQEAEILIRLNKTTEVYQLLKSSIGIATSTDSRYWTFLAQLAWQEGDYPTAKIAYERLYDANIKNQADLSRFAWVIQADNPRRATELSLENFHLFPAFDTLSQTLYVGSASKQWSTLNDFFKTLSPQDINFLEKMSIYYSVLANIEIDRGNKPAAIAIYAKGLNALPNDPQLLNQYLWLLIDMDNKIAMQRFILQYGNNPALMEAINSALITLGRYQVALQRYRFELPKHQQDIVWLLDYADLLDEVAMPSQAIKVRDYVWQLVIKAPKKDDLLIPMGRLSSRGAPPLLQLSILNRLQANLNETSMDQLMLWALAENVYELAFLEAAIAKQKHISIAPWMNLNLALEANDKNWMQQLFSDTPLIKLPHRDRVEAKNRMGDIKEMQELAYRGLSEHPNDTLTYQQFQDLLLPYTHLINAHFIFRQFGVIGGLEFLFGGRYVYSPSFIIEAFSRHWSIRSQDTNVLYQAPAAIDQTGINLKYQSNYDVFELLSTERSTVKSTTGALFSWKKNVDYHLNTTLSMGLNQMADETTLLLLGGKKNNAKFELDYRLTERDSAYILTQYSHFYDLNSVYLGQGENAFISERHRFQFAYPDWNILSYLSLGQYQSNNRPSLLLNRFIPFSGTEANLYLPSNFYEFGAILGYGQSLEDDYTHAFRLFWELGISQNSVNGFGKVGTLGIAGALLGRDHLALYVHAAANQGTAAQLDYTIGMKYSLYL